MQAKKAKNKEQKRILDEATKSGTAQMRQIKDPVTKKNEDDEDALPELTPERVKYLVSIMNKLTSLATQEERARLVDTLAPETVEQLRIVRNPYHLPVFKSTHEGGSLCFSVINIAEKYQKRLAMTSLIAFVYQMMEEYEPPGKEQYPSENDALFAGRYNIHVQQAEREKPLRQLDVELARCQAEITRLRADDAMDPAARQTALVKAAKESFRIRARIAKYKLLYYGKDLTSLEDLIEATKREVSASENDLTAVRRELEVAQIKWHKRQLHHAGNTAQIEAEELEKWGSHRTAIKAVTESRKALTQAVDPKTGKPIARTTADDLTPELKNQQYRMVEEILHAEDIRADPAGPPDANGEVLYKPWDPVNNRFTTKIASAQHKLEAGKARADKAMTKREELTAAHKALQARITDLQTTYKGLKAEWDARFVTPLKVEAVKAKKQETRKEAKKSGEHPLDAIEVSRVELDEAEYDAIVQKVKAELGITLTREEFIDQRQEHLEHFLNSIFRYNPQNHVRCAYKPNYPENPTKPPTEEQIAELQQEAQRTHARSVIPPDDTFYRLDRFQDAHYEELRQATDDIYAEKSDFEFAIVPYDSFRGEARHEKAAEFRRKYAGEFEADIHEAEYGQWTFLSAWQKNRERRDFVTKDSEILKRIMDQNELDQKAGAGINALRKRKAREKNTAEHGEHAASFGNIKKQQAASLERHGAKPTLKGEEIGRDDRPSNPDEVEVGVFEVKPQRVGKRRIRGHTEKWNFMIPSVPLDDNQIKVQSAQEFRGEQARQEAQNGHL